MRPRIVILSAFLTPFRSGAEACAEEVAVRLGDRYDITIVTAKMRPDLPRKDLLDGKIPVVRVGMGSSLDKWLFPFLAPAAAKKLQPAVIHSVLETFAGLALAFCRKKVPDAKRLLTLQTTNRQFLRRFVLRSAHRVTAISSVLRDQAETMGAADVVLIPNGVDWEAIHAICKRTAKETGRLLFVGRLEKMKGIDTLLRACVTVFVEDPDAHLHIVGDGSQRKTLERLARSLGIAERVAFIGRLPAQDVYRAFAEAEIFCGLSKSEALGNVFLEAQAAGCGVVATRVGGIPDIVKDGTTGILVPPDDPKAASDALLSLLTNLHRREQMAAAAKAHATLFGWDDVAGRYGKVYETMTGRSGL